MTITFKRRPTTAGASVSSGRTLGNTDYLYYLPEKIHPRHCFCCRRKLCQKAGEEIKTSGNTLYLSDAPKTFFPVPGGPQSLFPGLPHPLYFQISGNHKKSPHLLKDMAKYDDEQLLNALMELPGVGIKVANCTALFGFHRTALAPVDVWIKRVIDQKYEGSNPFPPMGKRLALCGSTFSTTPKNAGMK